MSPSGRCVRGISSVVYAPGSALGPRPKARRSPPPPRARDRERSPHNPGSQHSDHRTLCRASEHLGCEPRSSDGSHPNRRADHTDHNDQATQSSSRLGETPPEVLESSRGRSPLIIKDLDLYPQPPTNTRSPTLNSEEPQIRHPYGCHTWLLSRGPKLTTLTRAHHAHGREPSNKRASKRHAL